MQQGSQAAPGHWGCQWGGVWGREKVACLGGKEDPHWQGIMVPWLGTRAPSTPVESASVCASEEAIGGPWGGGSGYMYLGYYEGDRPEKIPKDDDREYNCFL